MGITVLSLFDGISCGMVALERAGIEVDKYIAYEIEHNAIEISKKNYPEIVRGGDVTKEDFTKYKGKIDILIGGSPCQNLCSCGNRKGLWACNAGSYRAGSMGDRGRHNNSGYYRTAGAYVPFR